MGSVRIRRIGLAGRIAAITLCVTAVGLVHVNSSSAHASPKIAKEAWGSTAEGQVDRYTLTNARGMRVRIITYGGILQTIEVPDRRGRLANVTLGFDNLSDYVERSPFFGCITGRYANRIANGTFTLNGLSLIHI